MRLTAFGIAVCLVADPGFVQDDRDSPGPRLGHAIVYDESRGRTVLFGGAGENRVPSGDTWEWDRRRWRRVATDGPIARNWPSMAYDARRREVVLFGGREAGGRDARSLDDLWKWNGTRWRRVNGATPPGRDHAGMVYDRARGEFVLFGGWDGKSTRDDTWLWNERTGWREVEGPGPAKRAAQAMVYDERRNVTWLHGGRDLALFYDDLWSFDGLRWTRHDVTGGPSPRGFQAAFFEPAGGVVVIYGGISPEPLSDTWIWNGRAWSRQEGAAPSARSAYTAAYDRETRSALLHGGGHRTADGWWISGETWRWTVPGGWQALKR